MQPFPLSELARVNKCTSEESRTRGKIVPLLASKCWEIVCFLPRERIPLRDPSSSGGWMMMQSTPDIMPCHRRNNYTVLLVVLLVVRARGKSFERRRVFFTPSKKKLAHSWLEKVKVWLVIWLAISELSWLCCTNKLAGEKYSWWFLCKKSVPLLSDKSLSRSNKS